MGQETETAFCPDWYPLFIAADRCNCKPWELLEQSTFWSDKALIATTAENQAREIIDKNRQQQQQ